MKNIALGVSAVVFLLVAIMHLIRLVFKIPVMFGSVLFPQWVSIIGFILTFSLSMWMFSLLKKKQ